MIVRRDGALSSMVQPEDAAAFSRWRFAALDQRLAANQVSLLHAYHSACDGACREQYQALLGTQTTPVFDTQLLVHMGY